MHKQKLLVILMVLVGLLVAVWIARVSFFEERSLDEAVKEDKKMDTKFLKTSDDVNIAYDLFDVLNSKKWFVLVHMMTTTKESWSYFAKQAQQAGVASIAIDLRGHGQSTGGPDDVSVLDIKTAANYLVKRGVGPEKITFIGASIGANLVLQFIAENPEFKRAILLSPGLNYRGIETLPLVKKLSLGQGVWFIAAEDDERSGGNAGAMAKQLYEATPAEAVERRGTVFAKGGHGTEILKAVPELAEKIIEF